MGRPGTAASVPFAGSLPETQSRALTVVHADRVRALQRESRGHKPVLRKADINRHVHVGGCARQRLQRGEAAVCEALSASSGGSGGQQQSAAGRPLDGPTTTAAPAVAARERAPTVREQAAHQVGERGAVLDLQVCVGECVLTLGRHRCCCRSPQPPLLGPRAAPSSKSATLGSPPAAPRRRS